MIYSLTASRSKCFSPALNRNKVLPLKRILFPLCVFFWKKLLYQQYDKNGLNGYLKHLPVRIHMLYNGYPSVGTWRSLVAHTLGVRGVGGSNPPVPTIF